LCILVTEVDPTPKLECVSSVEINMDELTHLLLLVQKIHVVADGWTLAGSMGTV
jgi:hypothetical protein